MDPMDADDTEQPIEANEAAATTETVDDSVSVSESVIAELLSFPIDNANIGLQALERGTPEEQKVTAYFKALWHHSESGLIEDGKILIQQGLTEQEAQEILDKDDLPFKLY